MFKKLIPVMTIIILNALLIIAPQVSAETGSPKSPVLSEAVVVPVKGIVPVVTSVVGDPILTLKHIKLVEVDKRKEKIEQLVKAVKSIEDKGGAPLNRERCVSRYACEKKFPTYKGSERYRAYKHKKCLRKLNRCYARDARWLKRRYIIAEAALNAQEKTGVDATLMIAVGRMESDFRNLVLINPACKFKRRTYNCYADCGMTQHHVRGSLGYVTRECNKLAKSPKYSFLKSAQELARHITWCQLPKHTRYHKPARRCILNRYNMGPFYKRMDRCKRQNRCGLIHISKYSDKETYMYAYSDCKKRRRKCVSRAGYWKQVSCFEYGARHQTRSKRTCRKCYRLNQIPTRFYPALQKDGNLTSFLFKAPFSRL